MGLAGRYTIELFKPGGAGAGPACVLDCDDRLDAAASALLGPGQDISGSASGAMRPDARAGGEAIAPQMDEARDLGRNARRV